MLVPTEAAFDLNAAILMTVGQAGPPSMLRLRALLIAIFSIE